MFPKQILPKDFSLKENKVSKLFIKLNNIFEKFTMKKVCIANILGLLIQ